MKTLRFLPSPARLTPRSGVGWVLFLAFLPFFPTTAPAQIVVGDTLSAITVDGAAPASLQQILQGRPDRPALERARIAELRRAIDDHIDTIRTAERERVTALRSRLAALRDRIRTDERLSDADRARLLAAEATAPEVRVPALTAEIQALRQQLATKESELAALE